MKVEITPAFLEKVQVHAEDLSLDIHSVSQLGSILSLDDEQYDSIIDMIRTRDESLAAFITKIYRMKENDCKIVPLSEIAVALNIVDNFEGISKEDM